MADDPFFGPYVEPEYVKLVERLLDAIKAKDMVMFDDLLNEKHARRAVEFVPSTMIITAARTQNINVTQHVIGCRFINRQAKEFDPAQAVAAALFKPDELLPWLIEHGYVPPFTEIHRKHDEFLLAAARMDNLPMIEWMCSHKSINRHLSEDSEVFIDMVETSAGSLACSSDNVLKWLFQSPWMERLGDWTGHNLLVCAITSESQDKIQCVLEFGRKAWIHEPGMPLRCAIFYGDLRSIELFSRNAQFCNEFDGSNGKRNYEYAMKAFYPV